MSATRSVDNAAQVPLDPEITTNGGFQFSFTNVPGVLLDVFATTNAALPQSLWALVGPAQEISPGQFQFTDPLATNGQRRFYALRLP